MTERRLLLCTWFVACVALGVALGAVVGGLR